MGQVSILREFLRAHARFIFFALLLIVTALSLSLSVYVGKRERPMLRVTFLDVGQGDAIFIESPTGIQMLIDGGPGRSVLRQLSEVMGFWDRHIDTVLLTHEDKDHVGGLPDVFSRYEIGTFVRTENQGESGEADLVDVRAEEEGSRVIYARRGMQFDLGGGAVLTVLFPDRDPSFLESNTSSIVARLTYGDTEFLFTGDSPQAIERYLISQDSLFLDSDVLKLGHHGSKTSTSQEFVEAVDPDYAIVSAEKNSRYGHPHKEVVEVVTAQGATLLNTADLGSITFETDGRALWLP